MPMTAPVLKRRSPDHGRFAPPAAGLFGARRRDARETGDEFDLEDWQARRASREFADLFEG